MRKESLEKIVATCNINWRLDRGGKPKQSGLMTRKSVSIRTDSQNRGMLRSMFVYSGLHDT
uniref:Uncharacterized protein n=1 Tax=Arion vulgaris TaxID=1028688 RepID=A0A0B7BF91_9EUPU